MTDNKKLDPQAAKEYIGKHLRTADEFARQTRYEEALLEIEKALEIDPKNNYARSFYERIKLMHKRNQSNTSVQTVTAEQLQEERTNLISQHLSKAEELINKKDYPHALEEVAKVYKIDPQNYYAQSFSERIDILMHEKSFEDDKPVVTRVQPEVSTAPPKVSPQRGSVFMYRELLKEAWFDGKITDQEALELGALRDLFAISQEDHVKLEREIKIEAYLEALKIAWRDHSLSGLEQKALDAMLQKYGISQDEQREAEMCYAEIKHSTKSYGTILIVDPERESLVGMNKFLIHHGYKVFLAQRVEDALQLLQNHAPNLIFSEILFPKDALDGISFLKAIRSQVTTKHIPFFFVSAVKTKRVINACYRLGADHVLAKPADETILLAMVKGRIHR